MSDIFASAPCRQTDPELFFPEKKRESGPAKRICANCPLEAKIACAQVAVASSAMYGVWAGEYLARNSNSDEHKTARRNVEHLAGTTFRTRPDRVEKKESVEKIVTRLSLVGLSMPEIAEAAGISERTVLRHRKQSAELAKRRCSDCDRIMAPAGQASTAPGHAKYAASGLCTACYQRDRRAASAAS